MRYNRPMKLSLKIRIFAFLIVFIALMSMLCDRSACRRARASALPYALIGEGAVLYGDEGKTALTSLPKNYFAAVLGEPENGYVSVSYLDLAGKIEESKLSLVDYEPRYKYAEGSLRLNNDGHNVRIRSAPDHENGEVIADLTDGETLFYYGTVKGTAQIAAVGDEWYYVRFAADGETKRGYVYSLYVAAEPIPENVIEALPEPEPDPEPEPALNNDDDSESRTSDGSALSIGGEAITIVALCLPVIVITYLLFRKPGKERNERE